MRIEWDEQKDASNRAKHGVSFEEARALFAQGTEHLEIFDAAHSLYEERFIAIGMIPRGLIVVVWSLLEDDRMRIISARKATRREAALFNAHMGTQHD